jgi:hypothetical protein
MIISNLSLLNESQLRNVRVLLDHQKESRIRKLLTTFSRHLTKSNVRLIDIVYSSYKRPEVLRRNNRVRVLPFGV